MHILYSVIGFSTLIHESALIFSLIKYAGGFYLAYLGCRLILSSMKGASLATADGTTIEIPLSHKKALASGFLCNLLNPKASLFILSYFSQYVGESSTPLKVIIIALEFILATFAWFATMSLLLSHSAVARKFQHIQHWISRIMGGVLIALAIHLVL